MHVRGDVSRAADPVHRQADVILPQLSPKVPYQHALLFVDPDAPGAARADKRVQPLFLRVLAGGPHFHEDDLEVFDASLVQQFEFAG